MLWSSEMVYAATPEGLQTYDLMTSWANTMEVSYSAPVMPAGV